MITLYGVRLNQKGYIIYLTSATIEELKKWMYEGHIFADIWKRESPEGYQREPDRKRFKKIANYLEGKLHVKETLFPNSVILNVRQAGTIDFKPFEKSKRKKTIQFGMILIHDEALPFSEVDGQHRIRGMIEAYNNLEPEQLDEFKVIKSYPIPLTIIEGLDRPTEAIQFVVINYTQKKVDPALVLRILHRRYKEKHEKLEFFLRGKTYRLQAVEICDELNSKLDSPWCDKIIAPGDSRKGRVISEQNFVNTLENVYRKVEHDEIKKFLPLYWKAISSPSLWKECVGENAVGYSLQRSNGTYVFHWLFPFVYFKSLSLGGPTLKNFIEILKPVRKKYPPSFWERGGRAKFFTSKGSQKELVDEMIRATFPKKRFNLSKLPDKFKISHTKDYNTWEFARTRLIPLRLHQHFIKDKLNSIDGGATGVYVLYSFKHKFYVGRSQKADLKSRLQNHLQNLEEEYHIFNYRLCKDPQQAHDLECALYHLFPEALLINREHPRAINKIKCPFCAILNTV